jgi:isopenicillin N synthase-like dioxygenase
MSLGIDIRSDFDSVPVIDFGGMLGDDPMEKAKVAAALRDAASNVGFFYIRNHGVPQVLIDTMFAQSLRFFDRPLEEKMALHVKKSSHLLGYVAMKDENANQLVGTGDLHEAFDFVSEDAFVDGEFLSGDIRAPGNCWPDDLPGFQYTAREYSIVMRRLARRMFAAFALALDLPENYFEKMTDRPMSLVRMLYYPSQPGPFDESKMGTGAHTDHECFTILGQDSIQALQVRNHSGQWIDAPRIPGTYVVNIGDQMARWTNGFFASTFHRVANLSGRARYSIPCFVGANPDTVIEALPSCTGPDNPPKFPPVVAGDYVSSLIYHQFHENHAPHPSKSGHLDGLGAAG